MKHINFSFYLSLFINGVFLVCINFADILWMIQCVPVISSGRSPGGRGYCTSRGLWGTRAQGHPVSWIFIHSLGYCTSRGWWGTRTQGHAVSWIFIHTLGYCTSRSWWGTRTRGHPVSYIFIHSFIDRIGGGHLVS